MRKTFMFGVCTLVLAASAVTANAQTGVKLAYINSQQLFSVVPGREAAAAQLNKEQTAASEQFKVMQDSLIKLQDIYTKEKDQLVQAEKLKTFKEKEAAFNEKADKIKATIEDRTAELQQPLMEMIQKAIEDYRAELGYTVILDVASGQGIAAIDKNLDVTEKIAARLAKMPAPKVTAATDPKPDAKKPVVGPAVNPVGPKKPPTK
ncbi:MAG: OmpH family outer membrane protein [Gemmatimonas sp.]